MSEPKWTPGPWRISPWSGQETVIFDHGGVALGEAWNTRSGRAWSDEALANAHLMAAAPDLYAALAVLVGHADEEGWWSREHIDALTAAHAALARARGELK
jgi:hypothetical protein